MWPTGTWSAYDRIINENERTRSGDCMYHFLDLDLLEWVEPTCTCLHVQRPMDAVLFALCIVLAINYRRELLVRDVLECFRSTNIAGICIDEKQWLDF